VSNRRKIDLDKLARVMARDMVRQSMSRPAPSVNESPEVAGPHEPGGTLRAGDTLRLHASGVLSEEMQLLEPEATE
jgi:hypothetical protein